MKEKISVNCGAKGLGNSDSDRKFSFRVRIGIWEHGVPKAFAAVNTFKCL